jgi:hypothetical protein
MGIYCIDYLFNTITKQITDHISLDTSVVVGFMMTPTLRRILFERKVYLIKSQKPRVQAHVIHIFEMLMAVRSMKNKHIRVER